MENLTIQYLESVDRTVDYYPGLCGDLADDVISHLGEDRVSLLYIRSAREDSCIYYWSQGRLIDSWLWHAAPIIDGMVHDAWFPDLIMIPDEYIRLAFPEQDVQWSIYDGNDDDEFREIS